MALDAERTVRMSAFEVHPAHIDALLSAGLFWRPGPDAVSWYWPPIDADSDRGSWTSQEMERQIHERTCELTEATAERVGAMLAAENRRSVDHRYNEEEWEEVYEFRAVPGVPDPVLVLAAISCYEYQACEHPGWNAGEARVFCQTLRHEAITRLPGYQDAVPHSHITSHDVFTRTT